MAPHPPPRVPRRNLFSSQFLLLALSSVLRTALAATPTASVDVYASSSSGDDRSFFEYSLHASRASFGTPLPFGRRAVDQPPATLTGPPADDPFLCNEADNVTDYTTTTTTTAQTAAAAVVDVDVGGTYALMVPRGGCTFERKALSAQRLGASAVVVRNTLASRYRLDESGTNNSTGGNNATNDVEEAAQQGPTYEDIVWPRPKHDYDCDRARAVLPKSAFSFDPLPYDAGTNDALLTGTADDGNLCALAFGPGGSFESACPSLRCLLTGNEFPDDDGLQGIEACCAWDLHFDMGSDRTLTAEDERVAIPALFVTMRQGSDLLETMGGGGGGQGASIVAYERWYPVPNSAAFLLWMLGIFVTWLASYLSASEYRKSKKRIKKAVSEGRAIFQGSRHRNADLEAGRAGRPAGREGDAAVAATAAADGTAVDATVDAAAAQQQIDEGAPPRRQQQQPESRQVNEGDFEDEPPLEGRGVPANEEDLVEEALGGGAAIHLPEESLSTRDPPPTFFNAVPIQTGPPQQPQPQQQQQPPREEGEENQQATSPPPSSAAAQNEPPPTLELNMYHVAGFIVFASAALFILFYFKIYRAVTVLYGIGCSGAMASVLFHPLYYRLARRAGALHVIQAPICPKLTACGFNTITWLEVSSVVSAYSIGISWLYVFFTMDDPHTNAFYWIAQDVMGGSVCVAFLGVIRLNSMKIASVLLVAVFVYDIFMVFITPLFTEEGDSVMVTVATSGGPPDDPDYCEKYPTEGDCRGGDPLPMLLTVPRVNDYRGGMSLLGLGDIVLPGLLISFAARLDSARRLLKTCTDAYLAETAAQRRGTGSTVATAADDPTPETGPSAEQGGKTPCGKMGHFVCGGYLTPLTIAYAIGLGFANVAVYLMERGQPALLYIVPACLGTMIVLGWWRGELKELWAGSDRIKKCDRIVASVRSSSLSRNSPTRGGPESTGSDTTETGEGGDGGPSRLT